MAYSGKPPPQAGRATAVAPLLLAESSWAIRPYVNG
jgi:hypothetical protein